MIRVAGVLCIVVLLYAAVLGSSPNARELDYQRVLAGWLGFYGVLTVGVGVLIVAGGIDLSIGSVVGLGAVTFGLLLEQGHPPALAAVAVLAGGALLGLLHGLLVTKLGLQPFLVTLCGLFIYRGVAKGLTGVTVGLGDSEPVFALKALLVGDIGEGASNQVFVLLACAAVLGLFLHGTRHGRYLFAIGANEEAAKYAGIATDRYKIVAYVICSTMASLGSVLYLLDNEGANPSSAGQMLELYAITGAVLGGCSLRGGEGTVPGMVLGAAVLPLLKAVCDFNDIDSNIQYAVIGMALLLGTILDELIKRGTLKRAVLLLRPGKTP
jgi:ribose transport system permease protein